MSHGSDIQEVSLRTPAVAFLVSLAATLVLSRLAPRLGWTDDGADAPGRKRQRAAIPLIGGAAIGLALVAVVVDKRWLGDSDYGPEAVLPGFWFDHAHLFAAFALAFVTGLLDDARPRGLAPLGKLAGQILAAAVLAHGLSHDGASAGLAAKILCGIAAVVAQNAANTFDNADGALCALAGLGLLLMSVWWGTAEAVLAFLPFNLWLRRPGNVGPQAYLGDSGSHLLGLMLIATPAAWGALVLPTLDLGRVAVARFRAGQPIWIGDRRHLAHRLQDTGRGPTAVVAILVGCALPAIVGAWFPSGFPPARGADPSWLIGGCLGSVLLMMATLALHPARPAHE